MRTLKKSSKVKTLTFQHSWLDRYRWLVYSDTLRGGLCKFCVLFPPKDERVTTGVFVSKPFRNLAKASGKDGAFNNYDGNRYHNDAMERATTFQDLADEPTKSVPYLISKKKQQLYNQNFKAIQYIVECILKQNLA